MSLNRRFFNIAIFVMFFVFMDQLIKYVLQTYFSFIISENYGIIFGTVENNFLKILIILIGIILLIYLIFNTDFSKFSNMLAISLIIAGAISNILDRFIYGYVVDYINLPSFLSFWPTFNLADIFIVIGLVVYLYNFFKSK